VRYCSRASGLAQRGGFPSEAESTVIAEMLADPAVQRIAVRYLIDKVAPFAESPLTGDSESMDEYRIGRTLAELRGLLALPEIPKSSEPRLRFLADAAAGYAATVGVPVDRAASVRAYVYLFVPLEEQAEFTRWEIARVQALHGLTPTMELKTLDSLGKRLQMNLNIYMEVKAMALSGGEVSQDEILAFEQAILHQMQQARVIVRAFET
jgi:hypothetical protein